MFNTIHGLIHRIVTDWSRDLRESDVSEGNQMASVPLCIARDRRRVIPWPRRTAILAPEREPGASQVGRFGERGLMRQARRVDGHPQANTTENAATENPAVLARQSRSAAGRAGQLGGLPLPYPSREPDAVGIPRGSAGWRLRGESVTAVSSTP